MKKRCFPMSSFVAVVLLAGCMLSPTQDLKIDSKTASFSAHGLIDQPNELVQIYAKNYVTGKWDLIQTGRSGSLRLRHSDIQNTDLYTWYIDNISISKPAPDPSFLEHWNGNTAAIKAIGPNKTYPALYTYDSAGIDCVNKNWFGNDPLSVGYGCSDKKMEVRILLK